MTVTRTVSATLALAASLGMAACDLSLDPGQRITGDFDAVWFWYYEIPSLGVVDEGSCDGVLEITSQRGNDFSGRHRLTSFGACIPDESGRIRGNVYADGDLDLEVELDGGRYGVFEVEPGCRVVSRDRRLEGRYRRGQIDAFADAHLRCFVDGRDRDVYLEVDLIADEFRRF